MTTLHETPKPRTVASVTAEIVARLARLDALLVRYGVACREDGHGYARASLADARYLWAWTDAIREDYQRETDKLLAYIEAVLP